MSKNGHAIIKAALLWALTLLAVPALAQLSEVQRAEFHNNNIVTNPGFENGKYGWTNTSGTFATITTSASVGMGHTSATWSGSTGNTLASQSVVLPAGLVGATCTASILHKAGDANALLEAYDVTASSSLGTKVFATNTNYTAYSFNFACPSSQHNVQLRIRATGTAILADYDMAFMGIAGPLDASVIASGTLTTTIGGTGVSSTATFPSSGIVVTEAASETLTNKTMGSTNTLTGATMTSYSNGGTVNLPAAPTTLVGESTTDRDAGRLVNKDFDTATDSFVDGNDFTKKLGFRTDLGTTGKKLTLSSAVTLDRTVTFPDATDTLVGKATTDTLTNKTLTSPTVNGGTIAGATINASSAISASTVATTDIDGGTASNTSRQTTPKASQSTLTALTRKQGTALYNTDTDQLLSDDGTSMNPVSVPAVKNYLRAGSSSIALWAASGAGITVTDDVTTADLPRSITTKNGILFTGASGSTAYGFYNFTLDPSDYNTKLQVQFAQACGLSGALTAIANCASSDFQVQVKSCTVAWSGSPATTCSGTTTRLALSTDSSAVSALPALTGTYRTTFDAPGSAAKFLQLQIGMNATQTHAIAISDVVVGPGVVTQGAAVSGWTSYTPTTAGMGTVTVNFAEYRRVGDVVQIHGSITSGTVTGSTLKVGLPTIVTANSHATNYIADGSAGTDWPSGDIGGIFPLVIDADKTAIQFGHNNTRSVTSAVNGNTILVNGSTLYFDAYVPTNEWVGAGTVNVVQNDCEYAYNTGASTSADDTTSFAYGPAGTAVLGYTSNTTSFIKRRVRFVTPISVTSAPVVEINDGNSTWHSPVEAGLAWSTINTSRYGIGGINVNATDFDVLFGKAGASQSGAGTYAATNADPWSGYTAYNWRVKKCAGGQAVGFATASQTSAGTTTSYAPKIQSSFNSVSSANYTVTDTDGYDTILVSTGASDRTITLPAVANAIGRTLLIKKTDSGAGNVVITPNGGNIDGSTSNTVHVQYGYEALVSDGSNWYVRNVYDVIEQSFNGQSLSGTGSMNNMVGITLTPGRWIWTGGCALTTGGTIAVTKFECGVTKNTNSYDDTTGGTGGYTYVPSTVMNASANVYYSPTSPRDFTLTANQTVYIGQAVTYTNCTSCSVAGTGKAVRYP